LLFFRENESRMILLERIILHNDSARKNHSAEYSYQNHSAVQIESAEYSQQHDSAKYSQQNDYEDYSQQNDSEEYIYDALCISLSFSGCYFWGRMRAELFCSTESFCRIFLAESFCCAE
jgi:hypothetical protein